MSNEIFSRCGNQCNLCLIYRPNVEKEDRRAEICAVWDKLGPEKYDPAVVICDGCLAEGEDRILFSSGVCKARSCVAARGLSHCGYCPDYPCKDFPAEPDAGEFYKEMESRGVNWTAVDDKMMEPYNPKKVIDEWRKGNRNLYSAYKEDPDGYSKRQF